MSLKRHRDEPARLPLEGLIDASLCIVARPPVEVAPLRHIKRCVLANDGPGSFCAALCAESTLSDACVAQSCLDDYLRCVCASKITVCALPEANRILVAALLALGCGAPPNAVAQQSPAYRVTGDAIVEPLTAQPGDPARGREVVVGREAGNCTLCHALPGIAKSGDIGPPLAGVGTRLAVGQLRLRLADATRINPSTAMPAYYRFDGPRDVAPAYRGRTVLDAQQIEDAIAYLKSLE
jgi:sulfur-oxidizing protein SoxX